MLARLLTLLLALMLVTTTALGGSASYLCLMSGQVGQCCCHHARGKQADSQAPRGEQKLQRQCCEVQFVASHHPPAVMHDTALVDLPDLGAVMFELPSIGSVTHLGRELAPELWARGPPPRYGPALYVWHSSYLI